MPKLASEVRPGLTSLRFMLGDAESGNNPTVCEVSVTDRCVTLRVEGHGNCNMANGHGDVVALEILKGVPRLLIWDDINREDTTQVVLLDGAKETRRKR